MKLLASLLFLFVASTVHAEDSACGTLEAASGVTIALKEGESVNFRHGGKLVHGTLLYYKDVQMYRVFTGSRREAASNMYSPMPVKTA